MLYFDKKKPGKISEIQISGYWGRILYPIIARIYPDIRIQSQVTAERLFWAVCYVYNVIMIIVIISAVSTSIITYHETFSSIAPPSMKRSAQPLMPLSMRLLMSNNVMRLMSKNAQLIIGELSI